MTTFTLNAVAHPKHYSGKIECIDCIESAVAELNGFEGFFADTRFLFNGYARFVNCSGIR